MATVVIKKEVVTEMEAVNIKREIYDQADVKRGSLGICHLRLPP